MNRALRSSRALQTDAPSRLKRSDAGHGKAETKANKIRRQSHYRCNRRVFMGYTIYDKYSRSKSMLAPGEYREFVRGENLDRASFLRDGY